MQFESMVLSNVEVSPGYYRMRMTAPHGFRGASPGQFVMVRVAAAADPLLRRPFGVFDAGVYETPYTDCGSQTYLEILYRVVGQGTNVLAALHHGDVVGVLGPLGNGFELGDPAEEKI
ncbi:MAG TPA: dihydroorotate dehydrogenase electron transfer subunit, partial [Verrucomicrobiae bacterium]|nr:dihydroorotate dehydrogenase electron transfer subunit [Verrucomicrobiae bacterium]